MGEADALRHLHGKADRSIGKIKLDEDKEKEELGSITIPEVAHDTEADEYVVRFP